jgi:predicted nucleic acid-binding protein
VWAYFDASVLVKRYVDERGRRNVLRLLRRHEVVTSAIVPIELRSALRRRVAEGTLDEKYCRIAVPELVFVSADARQTAAAAAIGMTVRHVGS